MELIESDLKMITAMFAVLESAATVDGVHEVSIRFRGDGGDFITVGYGVSGTPAVISIEPVELDKNDHFIPGGLKPMAEWAVGN